MPANTLILIDREKIQFNSGGKIITFPISATLMKDLEIVDKNLFLGELGKFVQKEGVTFGSTLILLTEAVCFIDEGNPLQDFISTLPFENPTAISLGGKSIGTNKDLYEAVVELVGKYGGDVKSVAPIFISKETFGARNLDEGVAKFVLSNEEAFLKSYFSFSAPALLTSPVQPKAKVTPLSLKLGIVFAVLAIILVVLLVLRS